MIAPNSEMTLQEAADFLGMSPTTLARLINDGVAPVRPKGTDKRMSAADVLAYRDQRRAEQDAMLDELVAENQRAGLYDEA